MSPPSRRSFSEWEKEAATSCYFCKRKVLNKDASGTCFNHITNRALAWHAECAPSIRFGK